MPIFICKARFGSDDSHYRYQESKTGLTNGRLLFIPGMKLGPLGLSLFPLRGSQTSFTLKDKKDKNSLFYRECIYKMGLYVNIDFLDKSRPIFSKGFSRHTRIYESRNVIISPCFFPESSGFIGIVAVISGSRYSGTRFY